MVITKEDTRFVDSTNVLPILVVFEWFPPGVSSSGAHFSVGYNLLGGQFYAMASFNLQGVWTN